MSEQTFPAAGGLYEIDAKGALKQTEAPTKDATYDRGSSAPIPEPVAPSNIVNNFIDK